jgi:hypothetical protein
VLACGLRLFTTGATRLLRDQSCAETAKRQEQHGMVQTLFHGLAVFRAW